MSLDITLYDVIKTDVFSSNITHNLCEMAEEAGIYKHLWRPEELNISKASKLIKPLEKGLALLKSDKSRFERLNPINGCGDYDGFVNFVTKYLDACKKNPNAEINANR
jgi:hypothetical protein